MTRSFTKASLGHLSKSASGCNIFIEKYTKKNPGKLDTSIEFDRTPKAVSLKNKNGRINKDLEKFNIVTVSPQVQKDLLVLEDTLLEEPSEYPPTITQTNKDTAINFFFSERESPGNPRYASSTYESQVNECKSIFESDSCNDINPSPEINRKTSLSKWVDRRRSLGFGSDELKMSRVSKEIPISYTKNEYQKASQRDYVEGCEERISKMLYSIDNYQEVIKET
jgi:hypothetical protein